MAGGIAKLKENETAAVVEKKAPSNKLTDKEIAAFVKKKELKKKLFDGGGLHLYITPAGSPVWRIKYHAAGKEKIYSIGGQYPAVTLKAARDELAFVKALLREHKDPVAERRVRRAEGFAAADRTFEVVATEWLNKKKPEWSPLHYVKSARAFERDVFPLLGKLPIARITTPMVSAAVDPIGRRAPETAKRILTQIVGVFRYAKAKGYCESNPAPESDAVLTRKNQRGRMAALIDLRDLGDLLRRAQAARMSRPVYMGHLLLAYTAMRVTNVVGAEWDEFDLDADQPVWVIPREKMKKKDKRFPDHRVPLAPTLVADLKEWRKVAPKSRFVCPSPSDASKPIGREALEKMYRVSLALADLHSPHGWRSSLTSQALDNGFNRDVVLIATDHTHDSEVALAYDRGERFEQRIDLFNWWGSQLDAAQLSQ